MLAAFSPGGSACSGPILVAILSVASPCDSGLEGDWLRSVYFAEFAIPFLVVNDSRTALQSQCSF